MAMTLPIPSPRPRHTYISSRSRPIPRHRALRSRTIVLSLFWMPLVIYIIYSIPIALGLTIEVYNILLWLGIAGRGYKLVQFSLPTLYMPEKSVPTTALVPRKAHVR